MGYSESEFTFDQGNANVEPSEIFEWDVDYAYQHLDWQHQLSDSHALGLLFSHSKTDINAIESIALLSELIGFPPNLVIPGLEDFQIVLGIDDGYSERYDLELSHTGSFGEALKFDWGVAARHDSAKSQLHFSTSSSVSEEYYRLFGNTEYSALDWLTLNFGASMGHSDTIDHHPSWRISSNFHLNANNTIRLAANRATRAPTVLSANYYRSLHNDGTIYDLDLISDPDIQEEERDSIELGYFGFFYNGRLTVDLKLFHEKNENLTEIRTDKDYQGPLSLDNEVTFMTNSMESEDEGFEGYVQWRPDPRWLLSMQYSWLSIDAEHQRRINPDRISNKDDAVAEHTGSILVNRNFGHGISVAATWYYQSSVDWRSAPAVDSYDRLDLNIRKKFSFNGLRGRVELLAHNAFGEDYTEYRYFQQFEPRYYLRLVTEL